MEHLDSLFQRYDRILIFDTETTGLRFDRDEIIQFSAVALERSGVTQQYDRLIRLAPGQQVPPEIQRLTGITTQDVEQRGIPRNQAAREIAGLLAGNTLLTAYNAHFDLSFLFHMLRVHGDPGCLRGKDKLDLLTVYRDRRAYPHKLRDAIAAYGLEGTVQNSHQADQDALATVSVMDAMSAERDDLPDYINLFGYIPKYGPPRRPIRSVTYLPQPYDSPIPLYRTRPSPAGAAPR
mgnify:FL=1